MGHVKNIFKIWEKVKNLKVKRKDQKTADAKIGKHPVSKNGGEIMKSVMKY
jgi:hypothetical protein